MNKRRIKNKMKVCFEDGTVLEVSKHWTECIRMKYSMSWEEYWSQMKKVIDDLWAKGEVWTKFGIEDMKRYYEYEKEAEAGELTRARHAEQCIYTDIRACLMALAFKSLSKEGEKVPKVLGLSDEGIHNYDGEKMIVKSIDEEI